MADLPDFFHGPAPGPATGPGRPPDPAAAGKAKPLLRLKAAAEEKLILETLRHNNNRLRTAAALGISRMTLYRKPPRHGLIGAAG